MPYREYNRPSVNIGHGEIKREWRQAQPWEIVIGDSIAFFGKVVDREVVEAPDGVVFINPLGEKQFFDAVPTVQAFVEVKPGA